MPGKRTAPVEAVQISITSERILARLGKVITHSAFVEAIIEDLIAGFLNTKSLYVYALTANINISTRIEALRTVARMRVDDAHFADLDKLLNELKILISYRNKLAHGFWTQLNDPEMTSVSAIKSSGKIKFQCEYVNAAYLDWLAEQILKTGMKVLQFGADFGIIERDGTLPS